MENKTFVVAGCKRQFDAKFRGNPKYEYVSEPDQLIGLCGIKVVRLGTYWERSDVDRMESAIAMAEFKR